MEVAVHRAFLTIEGRKVRLTKDIAKQLPLRHWRNNDRDARIARGLPVPRAICKLMAKVFDRYLHGWLILVPDPLSGLAWARPVVMPRRVGVPEDEVSEVLNWDDLRSIPTVIL